MLHLGCCPQAFADLLPTPIYLPDRGSVRDTLITASQKAALDEHPVKAILLTNPNNPLARLGPGPTTVVSIADCKQHLGQHLQVHDDDAE